MKEKSNLEVAVQSASWLEKILFERHIKKEIKHYLDILKTDKFLFDDVEDYIYIAKMIFRRREELKKFKIYK